MTFKKLIIILTITVSLLITALLGTSYAWYQFDNAVTNFSGTTYTDNVDLEVIFINNSTINSTIEAPIFKEQVDEYSQKTLFTISASSQTIDDKARIAYQITLSDIKIDEKLAVKDLKYSLIETKNNNSTTITSGNFENFKGDTIILKEMKTIEELDVTYSYEFRIWLEEPYCTLEDVNNGLYDKCSNQNELMGKKLTGKINVSSAFK